MKKTLIFLLAITTSKTFALERRRPLTAQERKTNAHPSVRFEAGYKSPPPRDEEGCEGCEGCADVCCVGCFTAGIYGAGYVASCAVRYAASYVWGE